MLHRPIRYFLVILLVCGLVAVYAPAPAHAVGSLYVATNGDDANDCLTPSTPCATINAAIGKADPGDTIKVAVGTHISSGTEVVYIDRDIILAGGWDASFTSQNGSSIIDGEFARRGVTVPAFVTAYLEYFVIQNGDLIDGKNGIDNNGILTLEKVIVQHNGTNPGSGGISGINNSATGVLTLSNSAVINNGTVNNCFGGIWNEGNFTAINSTISGNISNRIYCYGAALIGFGTVSLNNTTIVNNIGDTDMMGAFGTFTLQHSLVGSCGNSTSMTSQGYNIISMNTCPITPANGDQFGTPAVPIDLAIDSLRNNGGPTLTHALLPASPAIDAGDVSGCTDQNDNPLNTDQRGVVRPQGVRCDIGAFEFEGQPAPPANDDFANAEQITLSFPFTATAATSGASLEVGEPLPCFYGQKTAWYTFTPSDTLTLAVDSFFNVNVYSASGPGFENLSFQGCSLNEGGSFSFLAEAGRAYYLQVDGVGAVQFSLTEIIPPPANDDFASATPVATLPFSMGFDTRAATFEDDEPASCGYPSPPYKTIWFAFTASQDGFISASLPSSTFSPFLAIYSGTGVNNLTQLGCGQYSSMVTFRAFQGQNYYFQVGGNYGESGIGSFLLENAPPPQVNFYFSPGDPSKYDSIQFCSNSYDPVNVGIQAFAWDFGDGARAVDGCSAHRYTADGDYTVQHSATTLDGRTASATPQVVQVRTHDVAITKIVAPSSANSGQPKSITVSLRNKAYPEMVQLDLYKSTPSGFVWVATVMKSVPALSGNRTTSVTFNYTFTSDDARIGKVTFKVIATLIDARDALPVDNEAISSPPTKVGR